MARTGDIDMDGWRRSPRPQLSGLRKLQPAPQKNQSNPQKEKGRSDDVSDNPHVGIAVMREQIDDEQQEEGKTTGPRQNGPAQANPIP